MKTSISLADLSELRRGLSVIDSGRPCTVGGKDTVRDWILGTDVRLRLSALEVRMKPHLKALDKEITRLHRTYATKTVRQEDGGEGHVVPAEKRASYEEAQQQLLDGQVELDLPAFTLADFALGDVKDGKNPLPVMTISDLRHIIADHPSRVDDKSSTTAPAVAAGAAAEDAPGAGEG